MPTQPSWARRGHNPTCWRDHEECALKAAKDMLDTRAAQTKAQAQLFHAELMRRRDGISTPSTVFAARRLLAEYHAAMKLLSRREG